MSEPTREGRILALIEAEFRADDPGLTALFDAFARHRAAPGAPRGRVRWRGSANRFLVLLLVPLVAMTVLAVVSGSRKAASGRLPCRPPAATGRPPAGTLGCPAGIRPRWPAPVPAHVRAPVGSRRVSSVG
jgi:hypothetical protein